MSYISQTNTNAAAGVGRVGGVRSEQVSRPDAAQNDTRTRPTRSKDQVELSQVARHLSVLKAGTPERAELINRVREDIDAGKYDTPERFEAAIDGIKEDLEFTL